MFKRHKGETRTYDDERQHLLEVAATLDPVSDQYMKVITRLDQLDKIIKRSDEKAKAIIPACITAASLVGIYVIQQFAGVIVPRALELLPGRSTENRHEKD